MRNIAVLLTSVVAAVCLVASLLTTAFAGHPPRLRSMTSTKSGPTLRGNVTVTGNLKLKKGLDATGMTTARGGEQVLNGLSVLSGGILTDSEKVNGTLQAQSAIVSQNLQATDLQASALTLTGPNQSTTALTLTGAASVSGGLTADSGTFNNLNVTGGADFSHAKVTGLNLNSLNLSGGLASLTLGSPSSAAPPLTLSANGHSALLTVDPSGALSVDQLIASGSISATQNVLVGGDLTAARILAPNAIGTSTPGPLLLAGSTIQLGGNATVAGNTTLGGDLSLGSSSSASGHVVANGNSDVAGTARVDVTSGCSSSDGCTQSVNFQRAFSTPPIVTITAAGDPAPGSSSAPKLWVTTTASSGSSTYSGFVIHYVAPSDASPPYSVAYNYHVVGS